MPDLGTIIEPITTALHNYLVAETGSLEEELAWHTYQDALAHQEERVQELIPA